MKKLLKLILPIIVSTCFSIVISAQVTPIVTVPGDLVVTGGITLNGEKADTWTDVAEASVDSVTHALKADTAEYARNAVQDSIYETLEATQSITLGSTTITDFSEIEGVTIDSTAIYDSITAVGTIATTGKTTADSASQALQNGVYATDYLIMQSDTGTLVPSQTAFEDSIAAVRADIGSGTGSATDELYFIVGVTTNAPPAGDSTLYHSSLMSKHLEVFRNGKLLRNIRPSGWTLVDSLLTVNPAYASNDTIEIWATTASAWTSLSLHATQVPFVESMEIGNVNDSTIYIFFNEPLDEDSVPDDVDFAIRANGAAVGTSAVYVDSDTVQVVLDSTLESSDIISVAYTSADKALQDPSGNKVNSWTADTITNNIAVTGGYTAQYQIVYDAMTAKPSGAVATAQNTMVSSLVSGGYWSRMDCLWIMAQEYNTNGEALYNWILPSGDDNLTDAASTTFTSLEGFTGDVAGLDYLNSNFNASTEGVNFTLNDGTLGVYCRLDVANGTYYEIGAMGGSSSQLTVSSGYSGSTYTRINSATALTFAQTNASGLFVGTRRSSSDMELYRNGASLATSTAASVLIPNYNLYILARNTGGPAGDYSPNQVSIIFIMDGCTDEEVSALNTIFETYMDAIGKGVE